MSKTKPGASPARSSLVPRRRFKNGHVAPEPAGRYSPALLKRMEDEAVKTALNPIWGTIVGKLAMKGDLTASQAAAAFEFAALQGRYDALKGMPPRSAQSPSYQLGRGGGGMDLSRLDPEDRTTQERLQRKRIGRVERQLQSALDCIPPNRVLRGAIEDLVVNDRLISLIALPDVRIVLDNLASHFEKRRRGRRSPG